MKPLPFNPIAGIGLEKAKGGNVMSPWWTYDCEREIVGGRMQYVCGGRFHKIKAQAVAAFSQILHISEFDVLCAQKRVDDEGVVWWRLTTRMPVNLPERPAIARPEPDPLAIDI